MARKSTKSEAVVGNIASRQAQKAGNPGKVRLHEGSYGEPGKSVVTKWRGSAGGRDPEPPTEKEPGKSRGPSAGVPVNPDVVARNRRG